jgi:hypothetical protein
MIFVFKFNLYNLKEEVGIGLIAPYNIVTIGIGIFQFHVSIICNFVLFFYQIHPPT